MVIDPGISEMTATRISIGNLPLSKGIGNGWQGVSSSAPSLRIVPIAIPCALGVTKVVSAAWPIQGMIKKVVF